MSKASHGCVGNEADILTLALKRAA